MSCILNSLLNNNQTLFNGIFGKLSYINNITINNEDYNSWINFIIKNEVTLNENIIKKLIPYEMYERIMKILHLNCMSFKYDDNDIGIGLFGLGSLFNHSCIANVQLNNIMEVNTGFGYFETINDIKKNEELCIQYAGENDNYQDRQNYLIWNYGFKCNCIRCQNESKIVQEQRKNMSKEEILQEIQQKSKPT